MSNPLAANTPAQALAYARQQHLSPTQDWYRWCLVFVHDAVGVPAKYPDAISAWSNAKTKRPGSSNPPAGAAVFWAIGRWGHVALSDGAGNVWSNDIRRHGQIDLVPISEITSKWGARYLGWTGDLNGYDLRFTPQMPKPRLSLNEVQHAARNANLIPGSEARIRLIRASLRTQGCGDDTRDSFRDMWRRWQHKCGFTGADADGIPGQASADRLATACGYVVVP